MTNKEMYQKFAAKISCMAHFDDATLMALFCCETFKGPDFNPHIFLMESGPMVDVNDTVFAQVFKEFHYGK